MTRRRQLLAALGTATTASLAGCGEIAGLPGQDSSDDCPPYDPVVTRRPAWRTRYGGPVNTAMIAADAAPPADPSPAWRFPIETHVGYHTPIVADGTAYMHDG